MIPRTATRHVRSLLRRFPAVALVGPRQAGKTTLARNLSSRFFDLEQESDRLALDLTWDAVCRQRALVVLDEAQAHPSVFPRLRAAIDAARKVNGRFLLLGSVSPALMRQVSESLAGRLAVAELTPFLAIEKPGKRLDRLWLCGGFPDGGILAVDRYPEWQTSYLRLLVERDLPTWGLATRPQETLRLLHMTAAVHGGLWNASEIGRSLGLSYHTVNSQLDYLEGAFMVIRLPAFASNLKKRLVRSPKLYWRDTGLLHALLGGPNMAGLLTRPWVGASWEGFVIEQILGCLAARGMSCTASHFRTSDGYEGDLLLEIGNERWVIEVKLTAHPSVSDVERLMRVADLARADRAILVTRTKKPAENGSVASVDLAGALRLLTG
jgi:predicted AAA+ superfamily ATPase